MHITNSMIHPQLRRAGSVMKILFPCFTERTYKMTDVMMGPMKGRHPKDLQYSQVTISTPDNQSLRLCIYQPKDKPKEQKPGVLWIHGGGYGLGIPEQDTGFIELFVQRGCTVISPDYRTSIHAPYPAALHGCYSALVWMKDHASSYNIRTDQLMVGGESAGGGLAAAVCIYACDRQEVSVAFQMPLYPMIDDRNDTPSAKDNNAPVWNAKSNEIGWKLYLGDLYHKKDVPPYASPARLKDFSNLPPAFSYVGTIEPFHDETVTYFQKLKEAGVPSTLLEYKGCWHAFDLMAPKADPSVDARKHLISAFENAMKHCTAPQK